MYGVGQLTLGMILTEARCRVTFIHERHDPLFGGRSPVPNLEALRLLINHIQEGNYDLDWLPMAMLTGLRSSMRKAAISPPTISYCCFTGTCMRCAVSGAG